MRVDIPYPSWTDTQGRLDGFPSYLIRPTTPGPLRLGGYGGFRTLELRHHPSVVFTTGDDRRFRLSNLEALLRYGDTGTDALNSELLRLRGEILLAGGDGETSAAERAFDAALDTARHQQAKSLELRAATSLARLWRDRGQSAEARELLAPVYGWFTEGFDTRDLIEAKAVLDALA